MAIVHLPRPKAGQLKVGSFSRQERMAKWNEGFASRRPSRACRDLRDCRLWRG